MMEIRGHPMRTWVCACGSKNGNIILNTKPAYPFEGNAVRKYKKNCVRRIKKKSVRHLAQLNG